MKESLDPRDYEIRIWYSAEKGDECFIAQVVEWPGIMAHGATREDSSRRSLAHRRKPHAKFSSRSKALWKSQPRKASNRQPPRWCMLRD